MTYVRERHCEICGYPDSWELGLVYKTQFGWAHQECEFPPEPKVADARLVAAGVVDEDG